MVKPSIRMNPQKACLLITLVICSLFCIFVTWQCDEPENPTSRYTPTISTLPSENDLLNHTWHGVLIDIPGNPADTSIQSQTWTITASGTGTYEKTFATGEAAQQGNLLVSYETGKYSLDLLFYSSDDETKPVERYIYTPSVGNEGIGWYTHAFSRQGSGTTLIDTWINNTKFYTYIDEVQILKQETNTTLVFYENGRYELTAYIDTYDSTGTTLIHFDEFTVAGYWYLSDTKQLMLQEEETQDYKNVEYIYTQSHFAMGNAYFVSNE